MSVNLGVACSRGVFTTDRVLLILQDGRAIVVRPIFLADCVCGLRMRSFPCLLSFVLNSSFDRICHLTFTGLLAFRLSAYAFVGLDGGVRSEIQRRSVGEQGACV